MDYEYRPHDAEPWLQVWRGSELLGLVADFSKTTKQGRHLPYWAGVMVNETGTTDICDGETRAEVVKHMQQVRRQLAAKWN